MTTRQPSHAIKQPPPPPQMLDAYLSPAETARRLGVSAKALRLYESRGLVAPLRAANGWRTYGPAQIARLHQVLALKHLGLPLSRIAEMLLGRADALGPVLALQEQALAAESGRVEHALTLVRAARAKLAAGQALSLDDLTTLTKETVMTNSKASPEEMKAIFDPLVQKHFSVGEIGEMSARPCDHAEADRVWDALIAEAKALMAKGEDPASPAARDLARRWTAQVGKFTGGDPDRFAKLGAVWKDAMADPDAAPKLPLNPEIFAFIGRVHAAAKASGE